MPAGYENLKLEVADRCAVVTLDRPAARFFSAGAELDDARAWEEMPQVTIAAIEGYAVGGGLALALTREAALRRNRPGG